MKKLLAILGVVGLTATSTMTVVSCGTPGHDKPVNPGEDIAGIKKMIEKIAEPLVLDSVVWGDITDGTTDNVSSESIFGGGFIDKVQSHYGYGTAGNFQYNTDKDIMDNIYSAAKDMVKPVVDKLKTDKTTKSFFQGMSDDKILTIDTDSSTIEKTDMEWNPNTDFDQNKFKFFTANGETENIDDYRTAFNSISKDKQKITGLIELKVTIVVDVNFKVTSSPDTQTVQIKTGNQDFYVVNDAGKPAIISLLGVVAGDAKELMQKYVYEYKLKSNDYSGSNEFANMRRDFTTKTTDYLSLSKPLITSADPTEDFDFGSQDNIYADSQTPSYQFAADAFAVDENFNVSGAMDASTLASSFDGHAANADKQFDTTYNGKMTKYAKEQAGSFIWDYKNAETKIKASGNQGKIFAYGHFTMKSWSIKGIPMFGWKVPFFVELPSGTRLDAAKKVSDYVGNAFGTDGAFWSTMNYASASVKIPFVGSIGLDAAHIKVTPEQFAKYISLSSNKTFQDALDDIAIANIQTSLKASIPTADSTILNSIAFNGNYPSMYDYNIATWRTIADVLPKLADFMDNDDHTATWFPYTAVFHGVSPKMSMHICGFDLNMSHTSISSQAITGIEK